MWYKKVFWHYFFPKETLSRLIYLVETTSPVRKRKAVSDCIANSPREVIAAETQGFPLALGVIK